MNSNAAQPAPPGMRLSKDMAMNSSDIKLSE